jgi:hypothetical protein
VFSKLFLMDYYDHATGRHPYRRELQYKEWEDNPVLHVNLEHLRLFDQASRSGLYQNLVDQPEKILLDLQEAAARIMGNRPENPSVMAVVCGHMFAQ